MVIGYAFQLKGPKSIETHARPDPISSETQELIHKRDHVRACISEGETLLQQYGALSHAVMNTNKAALQIKISNDVSVTKMNDNHMNKAKPVIRTQKFNKLIKEMKKKNLIKLDIDEMILVDDMTPPPPPATAAMTGHPSSLSVQNDGVLHGNSRVFSCDSFNIRAADELRLHIPSSVITSLVSSNATSSITITCDVSLLNGHQKHVNNRGRLDFGLQPLDIGFSILQRNLNGTFQQLFPYQKIVEKLFHTQVIDISSSNDGLIILFDNTYSWYNSKPVRYCITITAMDSNPVNETLTDESGGDASAHDTPNATSTLVYSETLVDEFFGLNNQVIKYINTVQQL